VTGGTLLRLTDCFRMPVHDVAGRPLGRLVDVEAQPADRFPGGVALWIRRGRRIRRVPWSAVAEFGEREIVVTVDPHDSDSATRRLLLARHVLDAQVVDLAGKRIARVGDVELALQAGTLRAVAVDVGLAPVARRLGLRRLAGRLREEPIGWEGIYITSEPGHRLALEHRAADVHRLTQDELMALVGETAADRAPA